MPSYQLVPGFNGILEVDSQAWIGSDPTNHDWRDYQAWLAAGNEPLPPDIGQAKTGAVGLLAAACGTQAVGGFSSSALGAPYLYPSAQTDQDNLAASVLASLLPAGQAPGWTTPFMCCDSKGVWARRPHMAAQIQQVGLDGKAFVLGCLTKLDTLRAQIGAATTVDQVDAIVWT